MKTADELLTQVNAFLDALPYERTPKSLYEPIRYVLSMGGKRIRPVLMLLGYNLYKEDTDKILMNAIALETYHNYTLLHDDLMDQADLRRGHETVHKNGMPILPSCLATVCWCWRMSEWHNATAVIWQMFFASLPLRRSRLARDSSTTWSSRPVMMCEKRNTSR